MSLSSLQVLADNRNALLLAEVAGLLHDWQKCIDMAVASSWRKGKVSSPKIQDWQNRGQKLKPGEFAQALQSIYLSLEGNIDLKTLCEEGKDPSSAKNHSHPLVRILGECHGVAHVDKELEEQEQQEEACDWISTAFGFEPIEPEELFQPLLDKVKPLLVASNLPNNRQKLLNAIREVFSNAWGDTRRPMNEVTLWEWGYTVASLYKASVTSHLLQRSPNAWRLLRVNFDVLGLYAKAVKIADLLGYQRKVEEACESVKKLIEEEYPLGNEVYRDTTGIYFTFPDLDSPADLEQEIRRRVEAIEPELAPRIDVTVGDGENAQEQLKGILATARRDAREALAQPFDGENLSTCWQQQWERVGEGNWELCPVCRLRPMKEGEEACQHCLNRRGSRIKDWEENPRRTIWIDELADHNGRLALIVGKFDLENWLSGDLVQTMLVRADPEKNEFVPKNPSPARLRRIWETCQRFWTETVEENILANHAYGKDTDNVPLRGVRLLLIPDKKTGWKENVPYDGTVNGKPISLLWREDAKHFVTIINLQLTGELEQGQPITVSDPDEPCKQISFKVQDVMQVSDGLGKYIPFLPLLSSPDQFLALVPAAEALEIAEKIRTAYTEQFGKVQNRLPLFLGLVFFPRKMPLVAVMDTARRMLDVPMDGGLWTVGCCCPAEDEQKQYLRLSQDHQRLRFEVPVKMGDGTTEDKWYPYFQVEHFADGKPDDRRYRFQYKDKRFVHVSELKDGDQVWVTPSRFAYIFLESTAQRFQFNSQEDVVLLEELPRLMQMWKNLKASRITLTSLRNVQALLENKAQAWGRGSPEYKTLVEDTLKEAGLYRRSDQSGAPLSDVVTPEDVTDGRFARCLELYLKILKQKL